MCQLVIHILLMEIRLEMLWRKLASLEKAKHCRVFSSGMADCCSASTLNTGDRIFALNTFIQEPEIISRRMLSDTNSN
uniref:Uncharacterized protein n=1 Tax=Ditylenchus dipsaci TaxID=166011 RepID=A0A915EP67_9BILA